MEEQGQDSGYGRCCHAVSGGLKNCSGASAEKNLWYMIDKTNGLLTDRMGKY